VPSLNDLKLAAKPLGDTAPDFDQIPAERGAYVPPPQPGSYRFAFPAKIDNFDVITTEKYGERVVVIFDADTPLTIVQSKDKAHDGEAYRTRLNNVPRERGREKILVSDLDYLLKAKGVSLPAPKVRTNRDYLKGVVSLAGQQFGADQEFSYSCNPKRAARFRDADGTLVTEEDPSSTLDGDDAGLKAGCGNRYYQSDIPKVDGVQPLEIDCTNPECGAVIRAFGNLRNFKP
jgi:hypothetical protein